VKNREHADKHAHLQMKPNLKRQTIEERRKAARFDLFFAMPTLKSISRIDGQEVNLINMSRCGALIESYEQISPGTTIFLRVITEEANFIIKGRITRCSMSPTNDGIFQSGIEFDEAFDPLPESIHQLKLFEDEDFLK
jgi:hypothetical protein